LARGLDVLLEPAQALLDLLEAQAAQPEPVALAPGFLAAVPDPAPAQQHLAQPMPATDEVLVGILASPAQVAHRLVLGRRRMHLGQKPGAEQIGQLARVHPHDGDTLLHDRLLSYAALVPLSRAH
jgi:hypothetical protein